MGRGARGVKGMTLSDGDYIVGCAVISEDKALLTITEGGFGKRCEFDNFSAHNRGVKGVMCHGISERTGKLAGIAAVGESDDIMMITNDGTIIRTPVSGIPFYGRSAGGVIVMRLSEGSSLVNFARLENDEELEAEGMASDEGTAAIAPAESDEKVDPTEDEIDLGGGAGNKPDEDDDI